MKPIQLKIQAFGPFLKEEIIDFHKLGESPLFLLNGPTGSGKSTILDAICFALYGESTGLDRKPEEMRTGNAPVELKTRVEFTFQIGTTKYRVTRSPAQITYRINKKTGTLENQNLAADATLYEEFDKTEPTITKKTNAVKEKIEQILNLDASQFRQVIVLPQGKFRELLIANSSQKEIIFSQLFQTLKYKHIEDVLKDKTKEARLKIEKLRTIQNTLLTSYDATNYMEFEAKFQDFHSILNQLNHELPLLESKLEFARNKYENEKNNYKNFLDLDFKKEELQGLKTRESEIQDLKIILKRAELGAGLEGDYKNISNLKSEILNLSNELLYYSERFKILIPEKEIAEANYLTAKKESEKLVEIHSRIEKLETSFLRIEEKENLESKISHFKNVIQSTQSKIKNCKSDRTEREESLLKLKIEEAEISKNMDKLPELLIEKNKYEDCIKEYNLLNECINKIENLNTELSHLEKNKISLDEELKEKNTIKKNKKILLNQNIAHTLAGNLEEGAPCPVCGSTTHPTPNKLPVENKVEPSEIEDLEREIIELEKKIGVINHKLIDYKDDKTLKETELIKLKQSLESKTNNSGDELVELRKNLEGEILKIQKDRDIKVNIQKKIESTSKGINELSENIEKENLYLQNVLQNLSGLEGQILNISKNLEPEFSDKGKIRDEVNLLKKNVEVLKKKLGESEANFTKLKEESIKLETEIKEKNSLHEVKSISLENHEKKFSFKLKDLGFESGEDLLSSLLSPEQKENLKNTIQNYHDGVISISSIISDLEKRVAGKAKEDPEPSRLEMENLKSEVSNLSIRRARIEGDFVKFEDTQRKLMELNKEFEVLNSEFETISSLSDLISGDGNKINLQKYVLTVLLDDVLQQASGRLKIMSKGRYYLKRKTEATDGRKSFGLDLEIFDEYTGKNRSVNTLSGGESFLAALSLALGLSDVVQSYSGGIKLDTLFIDEGFGSLDPESLELAIRSLYDLKTNGRTIGLISHVSELKEQIPLQIRVIPSPNGSTTKMKGI